MWRGEHHHLIQKPQAPFNIQRVSVTQSHSHSVTQSPLHPYELEVHDLVLLTPRAEDHRGGLASSGSRRLPG